MAKKKAKKAPRKEKPSPPTHAMTKNEIIYAIVRATLRVDHLEEYFSSGDRDPDETDECGRPLLYHALNCAAYRLPTHRQTKEDRAEIRARGFQLARFLVARGADVNFTIEHDVNCQYTRIIPLLTHFARKGTEETINFLLDNGADIEARDEDNVTPLFNAVERCRESGNADTFIALLKRGASLDHVDDHGRHAMDCLVDEDFHFDFARTQEAVIQIKKAGGWKSWAREPRRQLLALRVLCEQGRASPPVASISMELLAARVLEALTIGEAKSLARSATCAPFSILERLFPTGSPPAPAKSAKKKRKEKRSYQLRDGAGAGEFPKEIFWIILSYWHTSTDDAADLQRALRQDREKLEGLIRERAGDY